MPFRLDEVSAKIVWVFLGWRNGTSFATTCREAAEWLPGAVGTIELLNALKATRASVATWQKLENMLANIASHRRRSQCMPNAASVLHYAQALAAMQVLPPITRALVAAVQAGIEEDWSDPCQRIRKPWIGFVLSDLQHNGFEDFAESIAPFEPRKSLPPTVFEVCQELTQTAVACGEAIDVVGCSRVDTAQAGA